MVVTYVCRIRGILTQFAAATAANGTYLPIRGGADCENDTIKNNITTLIRYLLPVKSSPVYFYIVANNNNRHSNWCYS